MPLRVLSLLVAGLLASGSSLYASELPGSIAERSADTSPLLHIQAKQSTELLQPIDKPATQVKTLTRPVKLTIIIDDLGYHWVNGMRSAQLPAPVTLAVIPHTKHSKSLAEVAYLQGKELILHLPMSNSLGKRMEARTLTGQMPEQQFKQSLRDSLSAVPFIQGVNNHMGSKLTQQRQAMNWVMEEISKTPLYFVDSRTSARSKAYEIAKLHAIPSLKRDVFLDNDRTPAAILSQLQEAVRKARAQGYAVAIGHPYPETLTVLEQQLPKLAKNGIQIVPASAMFNQVGPNRAQLMTRVVEFP